MVTIGLVSPHSSEHWIQFSSDDRRKQSLIDRVHTAYQKYAEGLAGRAEYFASLSALCPIFIGREVEALDSDDFYRQAEGVLLGQVLRKFPISRGMLMTPARQYIEALERWEETGTLVCLRTLADAHDAFVQAYIPVFQHAARLKPGMIRWNFPHTVSLFNRAFMLGLESDYELWAEKVRSSDASLIIRLPLLAVYEWISHEENAMPEIFSKEDAFALRAAFQVLEEEEREALFAKLEGEDAVLDSDEGRALYSAIVDFASSFQRGLKAETFNAIAQTLVREWNKTVKIVGSIQISEEAMSDLDCMKAVLKALVENDFTEADLPDAILYHLPSKRAVMALKEDVSEASIAIAAEQLLSQNLFSPKEYVKAALSRSR